jgi:hypothetical protein
VSGQHHALAALYLRLQVFLHKRHSGAQICYTCGGKNVGTPNTVWCSAGGSLDPTHSFAENAALGITTEVQ